MARRFQNLVDVRRYLASVINRLESNQLDATVAGKLGFLSNILARVIEGSSLEERVSALEKKVEKRK